MVVRSSGRQGSWPPLSATLTSPVMTPTGMVLRSQRWSWTVGSCAFSGSGSGSFLDALLKTSKASPLNTFLAPHNSTTRATFSREGSSGAAQDAPRTTSGSTGAKLVRKGSSFVFAAKKMSFNK